MGWLILAFVSIAVAAFVAGVLATGAPPAPTPEPVLQKPVARPASWLIVTGRGKSSRRWEFPVATEGEAIGLFTQKGGNLAAIVESRRA